MTEFENIKNHVGHDIECIIYKDSNASIECNTCNEVIVSEDKNKTVEEKEVGEFEICLDHLSPTVAIKVQAEDHTLDYLRGLSESIIRCTIDKTSDENEILRTPIEFIDKAEDIKD